MVREKGFVGVSRRQGRAQRCGVKVCALSALSAISAGFAWGRAGFGILWPGPEVCGPSSPGGGSPVDQAEFQQLFESKVNSFFADMAMEKSANLHSGESLGSDVKRLADAL